MYAQNYYTTNMEGKFSNQFEKPYQRNKARKRNHREMIERNFESHRNIHKNPDKKYVKYEKPQKETNHVQQLQQQNLTNYAVQQTAAQQQLKLQQQKFYYPAFPQLPVQPYQMQSNQVQLQQQISYYNQQIEIYSNKLITSQYGYKFEDKYQLGQKIGQGGQGSVYSGYIFSNFFNTVS